MTFNKVVFFNYFHNGDVHISRGIVKQIVNRLVSNNSGLSFFYAHNNDPDLIIDIPNLIFTHMSQHNVNEQDNLKIINDTVYINTWYAQSNHKYLYDHSLTIDCLYSALNDSCKNLFNFSLEDISSDLSVFYPTIDYCKYKITDAQNWLNNHPQKKIFVSNGKALSGQAINFPMLPIISEIAKNHTDKLFILSNDEGNIHLPNVIYSKDIIKKSEGCDLNENSFISSYCDIIIGRASGSFTFSWTYENMFKRKTKFLCFSSPSIVFTRSNKFWTNELFNDKINYSAEFYAFGEIDFDTVKNIIESNI